MEILNRVNYILKYSEYKSFFHELNELNDSELFNKLNNMEGHEKEDFEDAIIGLTLSAEIDKDEKSFLVRYKKYIMDKSSKNIMEYLNNDYLNYLYLKEFKKIAKDTNYDSQINQKSIWDIYDDLNHKYDELYNKFKNNELTNEEHKFFKRFYLCMALYFMINKRYQGEEDIMYDVVEYFDRYPITEFDSVENRQLFIIYNLSKELLQIDVDSFITFDRYHNEGNYCSLGFFKKISNGKYRINISNLDGVYLEDEKEMFERLFTVFHELGHLVEDLTNSLFSNEEQEIIKMEKYMVHNDRDFYDRYHDSFFIERYADLYAVSRIEKLFKNKKTKIIDDLINNYNNKERMEFTKFINILTKRYYELVDNEENNLEKK